MNPLNNSFQNCKLVQNRLKRYRQIPTQNEHVYAICCRPEIADDVISGENVKTVDGYAVLNFEVASLSSFLKNISWRRRRRTSTIVGIKRKANAFSLKN